VETEGDQPAERRRIERALRGGEEDVAEGVETERRWGSPPKPPDRVTMVESLVEEEEDGGCDPRPMP
jgi:hypothetical protein